MWVVLALAVLAVGAPGAGAATLADKRAQAAEVAAQVDAMDQELGALFERRKHARIQLREVDELLRGLKRAQVRDERRLRGAEQRYMDRLVSIYQSGTGAAELVDIASAGTFAELMDRIDAARFISEQDQQLVEELRELRRIVRQREVETEEAQTDLQEAERRAAARARDFEEQLAERRQLLASLESDIRAMVEQQRAAEAERQARESQAMAEEVAEEVAEAAAAPERQQPATPPPAGPANVGAELAPPVLPPASGVGAAAASIALQFVGNVPYVWGGKSPSQGFDCSGLVWYSLSQAGWGGGYMTSYGFSSAGTRVPLNQLAVGDLIFGNSDGHVGIYIGGGSFVHAPRAGRMVEIGSMATYGVSHAVRLG